jgi:hypothetical protein
MMIFDKHSMNWILDVRVDLLAVMLTDRFALEVGVRLSSTKFVLIYFL